MKQRPPIREDNKGTGGMVASTVLRCDDSIKYHPGNNEPGISTGERTRFFSAANIAGGSL